MKQSGFRVLEQKEKKNTKQWTVFFLTLISVSGILFWIHEMFQKEYSILPIAISSMILSVLVFGMAWRKKSYFISLASFVVLYGILILANTKVFIHGITHLGNQILTQYNNITGKAVAYFVEPEYENGFWSYSILMVIMTTFLAYYLVSAIQKKHPFIVLLCWIPVLVGSIFFEQNLNGLLVGWCGISVVGTFAYGQREGKKDILYFSTSFVLFVGIVGASVAYYSAANYTPSKTVRAWKEDAVKVGEQLRYGSTDYPEGDLQEALGEASETRLKLHIPKEATLYLRGFTGSVLEDEKWYELKGKNYAGQYEGMIREYVRGGFHPLSQIDCYTRAAASADIEVPEQEHMDITIENVGASKKYIYIPYGISYESLSQIGGTNQDMNIKSTDVETKSEKYTFQVASSEEDAWLPYTGMNWLGEEYDRNETTAAFRAVEEDYRKFVYKRYLEGTTEAKAKLASVEEEAMHAHTDIRKRWMNQPQSLADIVENVRGYILNKSEENPSLSRVQLSSDGALLFRAYGVPSRYVEGYVIHGEGEVEVRGSNAHAWVEVYKEGLGWIPADVIPGYYVDLEKEEEQQMQQDSMSGVEKEPEKQKVLDESSGEEDKTGFSWIWIVFIGIASILVLFLLVVIVLRYLAKKKKIQQMQQESLLLRMQALASYLYEMKDWKMELELPESVHDALNVLWYHPVPENVLQESHENELRELVKGEQEKIYNNSKWYTKCYLIFGKHMEYPIS